MAITLDELAGVYVRTALALGYDLGDVELATDVAVMEVDDAG